MTPQVQPSEPPADDPHGPLKVGSRLRKYEILALIGRGGYASVYHARDTIFNRDVAIKVIHRMGEVTEDMVRRGQAEATFLAKIRHPNIVEVYDADITDGGLLYIVMELLVGRTLFAALREHRRLAVEEALNIGTQIATAVEAAHQMGAIHRDLKPENIFITAKNVVKVLDFGIAKYVNDVAAKTTAKDALQGSVLYMSPEHVQGIKVGTRTDIYALGIILYRSLYGEHPALIDVENPTSWAVAAWHIQQMPRPLSEVTDWIPRHISRIVSSACAKDPRDRPESMAALATQTATAMERFLAETHGELKGRARDLSQVAPPSEPPIPLPIPGHSPLRFQAFNSAPEAAEPPPEPPAAQPSAGSTIPGTGKRPQSPPVTAVQVRAPLSRAPLPVKPRRFAPTTAHYWLIAASISGAVVFGAATKFYFVQRRHAVQTQPSAPVLVIPVVSAAPTMAPSAPTPPAEPSVSAAATPPTPEPSAAPSIRKSAAKPKKLDASELRLKALEEELKRRERIKADPFGEPLVPAR